MDEQTDLWNALEDAFPTDNIVQATFRTDLPEQVASLEKDAIIQALVLTEGNRTRAASMLNIGRTCLIAKMKKYEFT